MATRPKCSGCPVLCSPLFLALPERVRDRAACVFRPLELRANTPLYVEGFPAHSVFAIRSGTCKALLTLENGKEQVLRALEPGDFAGLDALALETYPHTVIAATDVVVCHAPRPTFLEVVSEEKDFALELLAYLSDELRTARRELAGLGLLDSRARLSRLLLERMEVNDPGPRGLSLPLNRRDTAAQLGMAEASLSRQIASLEVLGVLSRRGRRLFIQDASRLRTFAEG